MVRQRPGGLALPINLVQHVFIEPAAPRSLIYRPKYRNENGDQKQTAHRNGKNERAVLFAVGERWARWPDFLRAWSFCRRCSYCGGYIKGVAGLPPRRSSILPVAGCGHQPRRKVEGVWSALPPCGQYAPCNYQKSPNEWSQAAGAFKTGGKDMLFCRYSTHCASR